MLFSPQILTRTFKKPPSGSLGLQTSCTGFWEFENTSWTDATGNGTTLTGTGSPTTTTGKVGNAANLVASTSCLQAASNTNIAHGGGSFSISVWLQTDGAVGTDGYFSKTNDTFGNRDWGLGSRFTGTNSFSFAVTNTGATIFRAEDSATITTGSFVHIVGTFDSGTGGLTLYKNGSSVGTGTLTGTANSSASATLNFNNSGATIGSVNSIVDQAGFWKGRVLSGSDVTALYNSGSGLSWAAMA